MNPKRIWLVCIFFVSILAVYSFYSWVFLLEWDQSPDSHFVSYDIGCIEIDYNYIPDFQVWGDGRIVWVEYAKDRSRRVLEGRLSPAQLKDILGKFSDAGFFNLFNKFHETCVEGSLRIKLRNGESSRGISPEDNKVFDVASDLRKGAGAAGKDYVPLKAYFYVALASKTGLPKELKAQYEWPDQKFGYTLESIANNGYNGQIEIKGDELAFAWMVVNSPVPLVVSNGVIYWIAVIIPGISPF